VPGAVVDLVNRGVEVWIDDDAVCFLAAPNVPDAEIRMALHGARDRLMAVLAGGRRLAPASLMERTRLAAGDGRGPRYLRTVALGLDGDVDVDAMRAAMGALVARHEALRTSYPQADGTCVRLIDAPRPFDLVCLDDAGDAPTVPPPPCLDHSPLLTAVLARRSAREHVFVVTVHAMAVDGLSLTVLLEDIGTLYAAARGGFEAVLPNAPSPQLQVRREREYLRSQESGAARAYWRSRLEKAPALRLHHGAERRPGRLPVIVPAELTQAVQRRAVESQTTPFIVLLTAYAMTLSESTGCDDLIVGSPHVVSRWHPDEQRMVVGARDLLPLRLELGEVATAEAAIDTVHRERLAALAHSQLPLEALVPNAAPPRRPGRQPTVGVVFTFQTFHDRLTLSIDGVTVSRLTSPTTPLDAGLTPGFDCGLMLWIVGDQLIGHIDCDGEAFDTADLSRLHIRFFELLGELVGHGLQRAQGEVADALRANSPVREVVLDDREGRMIAYVLLRGPAHPAVVEPIRRSVAARHPAPLLVPVTRIPRDNDGRVDFAQLRRVPVADPATLGRWEAELAATTGRSVAVEVEPQTDRSLLGAQRIVTDLPANASIELPLLDRFGVPVPTRLAASAEPLAQLV
jgi:hypothetical protein